MGDKSAQTAARFHTPTQGIGLQYQLYQLGFRVLLLDEYHTSSSCPDCQGNTTRTNIKRVNPVPGNINYMRKPSYMGCWSVKVRGASWSVMGNGRNGIEI